MKTVFAFLFILLSAALSAQQAVFPVIKPAADSITDFIPQGWEIIGEDKGDLNSDSLEDAVLVIQSKDTLAELLYDGEHKKWDREEDTKPRILLILFKNKTGYTLALQNNDFILRMDEGGVWGDPVQDLKISKNVLTLSFFGGSREKWRNTYKFRFQNDDWYLIGAEIWNADDIGGDTENDSYNFMTKKMLRTTSNLFADKPKESNQWKAISIDELKTFKTFIRPFTWEIEKDIFL